MRLYKTTLVIWTDTDPGDVSISRLAQDAEDGCAYCSRQTSEAVNAPSLDPEWDGTEFFGVDDEADFEQIVMTPKTLSAPVRRLVKPPYPVVYDSLNDWNARQNAAELAARPFYLMGQDTLRLAGTPRFATEDEAQEWVEANLGADAWNDTAILSSDTVLVDVSTLRDLERQALAGIGALDGGRPGAAGDLAFILDMVRTLIQGASY